MLELRPEGLYCKPGDFYIDPMRGVPTALITHAHSDHARKGSQRYLSTPTSLPLIKERLGEKTPLEAHPYGRKFKLADAWVSLHPAGHILGSAQVRIEAGGETWVITGDYKRDDDPSCEPFELVPCDTFVTEATFGLPIYRWESISEVVREIRDWWQENSRQGINSILYCYSLGKAQRVLAELARLGTERPVVIHSTMTALTELYREAGVKLAPTECLGVNPLRGGDLILTPPSSSAMSWIRKHGEFQTGFASGWMRLRSNRRSGKYDRSFVMSDHADWPSLVRTVRETGAKKVYVMHGENEILARYLTESGTPAYPIEALRNGGHK